MNDFDQQEDMLFSTMSFFPDDIQMDELPEGDDEDNGGEEEPDVDLEELDKLELPNVSHSDDLSSSPTTVLDQFHSQNERIKPLKSCPKLMPINGSLLQQRPRRSELFEGQESGSCLYNKDFMASLELSVDKLKAENAKLRQNLGISAHEAFASIAAEYKANRADTFMEQSRNPWVMDGETLTFLQKYWA